MADKKTDKKNVGARVADLLLDIQAVHFNAVKPFMLTSGWASPVYIDCRKIISSLPQRREIVRCAVALLEGVVEMDKVDFIAGGETAGIPFAAWISDALDKPMLYVRKKPKGFGRGAQIEGAMPEKARVLLVEDLATDGASKVAFAQALRDGGAVVTDVFSVFFYGIFKESAQILGDAGLELHYLATWQDVLDAVRRRESQSDDVLLEVQKFLAKPAEWSRAHGGAFERTKPA